MEYSRRITGAGPSPLLMHALVSVDRRTSCASATIRAGCRREARRSETRWARRLRVMTAPSPQPEKGLLAHVFHLAQHPFFAAGTDAVGHGRARARHHHF